MSAGEKTILVVEDEPSLLEAIKLKLEKRSVGIWTAANGDEAIRIISDKRPTLVWLDVLLPGINGLEVLRIIRKNPALKDLPVVIVSVSASPEKIKQAFSYNIIDYIIKSNYTIDEIIEKIFNILGGLP